MSYKERIFLKLTSGRFLIALALTIGFVYLAILGKLTEQYVQIFMIIITFYFSKDRISVSTSPTTTVITQESEPKVITPAIENKITTPDDGVIEGGQ